MRFIEDSGHAWLEVSLSEYPNAVDFGTGFGFLGNGFIYLEEDMDLPSDETEFMKKYHEQQKKLIEENKYRYDR